MGEIVKGECDVTFASAVFSRGNARVCVCALLSLCSIEDHPYLRESSGRVAKMRNISLSRSMATSFFITLEDTCQDSHSGDCERVRHSFSLSGLPTEVVAAARTARSLTSAMNLSAFFCPRVTGGF
jgi:hypothetical protein